MGYFIVNRAANYYNVKRTFLSGYRPRGYTVLEGARLDAQVVANRYHETMRIVDENGIVIEKIKCEVK